MILYINTYTYANYIKYEENGKMTQGNLKKTQERKRKGFSVVEIGNINPNDFSLRRYNSIESLRVNSKSLNALFPPGSTSKIRSISPSQNRDSGNIVMAKHEQLSTGAATASGVTTSSSQPAEKEKKRKEVSSSRVKKFHRHFTQISKDEKLINYFSCALVSDILLQGHLYITGQHFAFYSNVFGYVTKVVIPTSSVTKISKEKTAKIIPNAVGVATSDERHVFGSFISREAAFRLMCSVCPPLAPAEILPKTPADIEISEEYSIEDDSSCSISGNESPPQRLATGSTISGLPAIDENGQTVLRRTGSNSNLNNSDYKEKEPNSNIPSNAKTVSNLALINNNGIFYDRPSSGTATFYINNNATSPLTSVFNQDLTQVTTSSTTKNMTMIIAGTVSSTTSASSSTTPSTSSSPNTVVPVLPKSRLRAATENLIALLKRAFLHIKQPKELHLIYLGVFLSVILALFSVFLLYRILDIEAKTSLYRSTANFNWRSGNDDEIFADALRWQKELQSKSTEEAQNILSRNLEQIAKVRRSLETLSMLIDDRSSSYSTPNSDESD